MAFRSHLARPIDLRIRSNLALITLVSVAAVIALILWLDGHPGDVFLAPVQCFLVWALLREIDPDHTWTALLGGAGSAAWVLVSATTASVWLLGGLILGARVITATTGRRPLPLDLAMVAAVGIGIGFSPEGWAAGFALAVAVHLDERFSGRNRPGIITLAASIAIGTTVVATLTDAFGETPPDVRPLMAVAAGLVALLLVVREPAPPTSQVDARHSAFMDQGRLHTSRSVAGFVVFVATILAGVDAEGMIVVILALWLTVISNEVELVIRKRR